MKKENIPKAKQLFERIEELEEKLFNLEKCDEIHVDISYATGEVMFSSKCTEKAINNKIVEFTKELIKENIIEVEKQIEDL